MEDQTFRQIVRISLGGSRVRFVFSNIYGERPLKIGSATMALAGQDGAIEGDTIRKLTFGGKGLMVIPPGAPAISDPVNMNVDAQARLVVST